MAAARHLYVATCRRLVSSGADRRGDQFMGVHGIHMRMFSTPRGTPAGGLEAPHQVYNQDYYKLPDHHYIDQDYYNPSDEQSKISRDEYLKNMNDQKRRLSETDYDFKKLQQRIFRMEHDFARHSEKLHRFTNDIRDESKKLSNDLSKICEEHVAESKAAADNLIRDVNMRCTVASWTVIFTSLISFILLKSS